MSLSYTEYKTMNTIALTAVTAMLEASEESGIQPGVEELATVEQVSYERAGLTNRPAEIAAVKGFLGFMMMVSTYPAEFAEDIDFWIECHSVGLSSLEAITAGQDPEVTEIIMANPDVVMAKRFIINPSSIIKG